MLAERVKHCADVQFGLGYSSERSDGVTEFMLQCPVKVVEGQQGSFL